MGAGWEEGSLTRLNVVPLDGRKAWYILALLTLSYALAYIDRQILNLLVDPIKHQLAISDTEFSFIQGTAFVVAFLIGTPIFGRLVDISNRRNILIAGVIIWSVCTIACGYSQSYAQLFMARFGVGLSEASVYPVTWSLIGDLFSARKAPRAMGIFQAGALFGSGFSLIAGGAMIGLATNVRSLLPSLDAFAVWQLAFIVIGLPGVLLGLFLFTLREPARRHNGPPGAVSDHTSFQASIGYVWHRRSFYGRIYLAIGMIGVVQLSIPAWYPTFLIRAHGMPTSAVGYSLGMIAVIFGASGTMFGPPCAQWLQKRGFVRHLLQAAGYASVLMLLFSVMIPVPKTAFGAMTVSAALIFSMTFPVAIISATTQQATPNRLRGLVGSLFVFSAQIFGYGLGPTAVALITDRGFENPAMVGFSLQIIATTASAIAATMLFTVIRPYQALIETSDESAFDRGGKLLNPR